MSDVKNYASMPEMDLVALCATVKPLATLAEVIRWGLSQSPERSVVDVVVQDEYTHDVVMDWNGGLHLVFDTT